MPRSTPRVRYLTQYKLMMVHYQAKLKKTVEPWQRERILIRLNHYDELMRKSHPNLSADLSRCRILMGLWTAVPGNSFTRMNAARSTPRLTRWVKYLTQYKLMKEHYEAKLEKTANPWQRLRILIQLNRYDELKRKSDSKLSADLSTWHSMMIHLCYSLTKMKRKYKALSEEAQMELCGRRRTKARYLSHVVREPYGAYEADTLEFSEPEYTWMPEPEVPVILDGEEPAEVAPAPAAEVAPAPAAEVAPAPAPAVPEESGNVSGGEASQDEEGTLPYISDEATIYMGSPPEFLVTSG